jgi:hypothetical protein
LAGPVESDDVVTGFDVGGTHSAVPFRIAHCHGPRLRLISAQFFSRGRTQPPLTSRRRGYLASSDQVRCWKFLIPKWAAGQR